RAGLVRPAGGDGGAACRNDHRLTYRRPFQSYILFPRPMASIIPLLTEFENEHISERQALPEKYLGLSDAEMETRIAAARKTLGSRLIILGHHYRRDEVIKFA